MRPTTTSSAAVLAVAALVLGGCTVSGDEQAAPSRAPGSTDTGTTASAEPSAQDTPAAVSPEELSAQVLEVASAPLDEPIASQTVTVPDTLGAVAEVTIDVLSVERTDDATVLTMQMSSPQSDVGLTPPAFREDGGASDLEFFSRFALEDLGNGIRYRPLSWLRPDRDDLDPPDGPANSCICAYRGNDTRLGPEPIVFDAMYGPLPDDVTTVTLTAPGGVTIPDLPVAPAAG